jgi:hypothetical protein
MKRLVLILAIAALFFGQAEAQPWRYVCVCDSIAAETADTFYVETHAQSKAYRVIGIVRANMTGATDGAFSFKAIFDSDGTTAASDLWSNALETMIWNVDAGAVTLAPGNNTRTFALGAHFPAAGLGNVLPNYIMGDKLACIYSKGTVTGGTVSLYIWYQVLE